MLWSNALSANIQEHAGSARFGVSFVCSALSPLQTQHARTYIHRHLLVTQAVIHEIKMLSEFAHGHIIAWTLPTKLPLEQNTKG